MNYNGKRISNKTLQWYINLFKEGYYLQPEKYSNCTIVTMTKDMGPGRRKTVFEINLQTAKQISKMFGFVIRKEKSYFGKAEAIPGGIKRTFHF